MKNEKTYYTLLLSAVLMLLLVSCVKDKLYNTSHPTKGAGIITIDWSAKGVYIEIPENYTLRIGTEEHTVKGSSNLFCTLLPPGSYGLTLYNTAAGIAVSGNTATVNSAKSRTKALEEINPYPDYLFSGHKTIEVTEDDTIRVTVPVKQLVRQLNIELSVIEGDYSGIESVTATLNGVASKADIVTWARSNAAKVTNTLIQDENKFTTSFRLIGIIPLEKNTLTVSVLFTNGDTKLIENDITGLLSNFYDSSEPMTITGNLLLSVNTDAEVTDATITDWKETDGVHVDAN